MSPWNMKNSCRKLEAFGCDQILLTDRGTFFGYNMLINDMRSFPIMAETGYPVCYDATIPSNYLHLWAIFRVVNVNIYHI